MTQLEISNTIQRGQNKGEIKLDFYQSFYLGHHITYNFNEDIREFFFQLLTRLENEYKCGSITKTKFTKWVNAFNRVETYVLYKSE